MRCAPLVLLFCLFVSGSHAATPQRVESEGWVGAQRCAGCHEKEFRAWQGSHHDLAMQAATAATVLGDFNNTRFDYAGKETRFTKRGDEFWIRTEGPDGKPADYRVAWVFGVEPLQQYLLELPGGRLQALTVAWDSRPVEQGGQRWFHLYPDEAIVAGDPLHWTGPYHNWNSRCAECHSTNLQKNFDTVSEEYSTTWTEVNVACEACHGPGATHVELVASGKYETHPNGGFDVQLGTEGGWYFPPGESIARRKPAPADRLEAQQVESCGRCHARRGVLGEYHYGKSLLDTHRLSLLDPPLYHLDGQIRDEVYVYGSFLQSKMYKAGVTCGNCHDPHSLEQRAPGNAVCSQCHQPARYDSPDHHHHPASSEGALCANCHMPETTYMVVDPRRDHSMRVPRPDLSLVMGTPNACNQCHTDRDPQWALDSLRDWGVQFDDTGTHMARSFQSGRNGDGRAVPGLASIAQDPNTVAIWRATAMVALGEFANREAYQSALQLLVSSDPLLRLAAVRALAFLPPDQLYRVLLPLLDDPVAAVRFEVAGQLAPIPLDQLPPPQATALKKLFTEYVATLMLHADMPETQVQLGIFYTAQNELERAESAYRKALEINPQALPALLNLADLYRLMGRDEDARELLLAAIEVAPEEGAPYHALGLLETRAGNRELALKNLARAAQLEQQGTRHRYVYAIALEDNGDVDGAIKVLRSALRDAPGSAELLSALFHYNRQAGRSAEAKRYARRLLEIDPDNQQLRQLYESL